MKKAFTILEVSILFVIFLIVALLVVPLSLDDTLQAKNASRWRKVQGDFENIFYSISTLQNSNGSNFYEVFNSVMGQEVKNDILYARISMGHARVLSKLEDKNLIIELSNKVKKDKLSVRELEYCRNTWFRFWSAW